MNRNEKLGFGSLAVALVSCLLAALVVPEVRLMLGLPLEPVAARPQAPASDPPRVERAFAEAATGPTHRRKADPAPAEAARYLTVRTASASSVLPASRVAAYGPAMVLDGDGGTPWVENVPGYGIGEWIELDLDGTRSVARLEILNGYDKGARYGENGRVRGLTAYFSNGETRTFALEDSPAPQTFEVGGIAASSVRLVIASVYPGSRWEDTALGDVRVIAY